VMSEQKVPRSVEQRIVIKFLVGKNVPPAEIHHRLQQQYGEECLRRRNTEIVLILILILVSIVLEANICILFYFFKLRIAKSAFYYNSMLNYYSETN